MPVTAFGRCDQGRFEVVNPGSIPVPVICGENSGEHSTTSSSVGQILKFDNFLIVAQLILVLRWSVNQQNKSQKITYLEDLADSWPSFTPKLYIGMHGFAFPGCRGLGAEYYDLLLKWIICCLIKCQQQIVRVCCKAATTKDANLWCP